MNSAETQLVSKHINDWIRIGMANPWIRQVGSGNPADDCAFEAPWGEKYFSHIPDIETLKSKFVHGNWCLGQAFWVICKNHEFCFINQIDGGDEWLVIRDNIPFESWSCGYVLRREGGDTDFMDTLARMARASIEDLVSLKY